MELAPYIFFYGSCEKALEFYKRALGGTYELTRVKDAPPETRWPGGDEKVMHSTFTAPGITFMASDGDQEKKIDPDAGNISLSLGTSDAAEGDRVFKALSEGGKVTMPLGPAFWGGRFGMIQDQFGLEWMITSA